MCLSVWALRLSLFADEKERTVLIDDELEGIEAGANADAPGHRPRIVQKPALGVFRFLGAGRATDLTTAPYGRRARR